MARIRDKIAASKRKDLWMGGAVPLGYDLRDRELVINPAEAEMVRTLFRLYHELGTVRRLKEEADRQGLLTKRHCQPSGRVAGGRPFTRGHLYCLLSNVLYVGEVSHKGTTYPGRHEAIIDRDTFEAVQRQLTANTPSRRSPKNARAPSLLTGLVYDETGDRLCPTHANKRGRRYRYYISKRLMHATDPTSSGGWRLPAKELETVVVQAICDFLSDELRFVEALHLDGIGADQLRGITRSAVAVAEELKDGSRPDLLSTLLHRIVLSPTSVRVEIKRIGLMGLLAKPLVTIAPAAEELFSLIVPVSLKRRGVEAKLVMRAAAGRCVSPDQKLIALLAEAHRWIDELVQGRAVSLRDLARQQHRDVGEVSRTLPLAFLSPAIIQAILEGRQPVDLTPRRLKRMVLPFAWDDQIIQLGFQAR